VRPRAGLEVVTENISVPVGNRTPLVQPVAHHCTDGVNHSSASKRRFNEDNEVAVILMAFHYTGVGTHYYRHCLHSLEVLKLRDFQVENAPYLCRCPKWKQLLNADACAMSSSYVPTCSPYHTQVSSQISWFWASQTDDFVCVLCYLSEVLLVDLFSRIVTHPNCLSAVYCVNCGDVFVLPYSSRFVAYSTALVSLSLQKCGT
jgi:hypothetical protein